MAPIRSLTGAAFLLAAPALLAQGQEIGAAIAAMQHGQRPPAIYTAAPQLPAPLAALLAAATSAVGLGR